MAKLEISVDTTKKKVEVKLDGKKVDNVHNIYLGTEDSGYFNVEVCQREDVGDMRKVTRLVASANDENWQESEEPVDTKELASLLLRREID